MAPPRPPARLPGRSTSQAAPDPRIDAHLARFDGPQRATLDHLRATLRRVLPAAHETISYRMPAVAIDGKAVAMYDGFRDHCSYFPGSGSVLAAIGDVPPWAGISKGTLRFPVDRTLPVGLVRRLVRAKLDELAAVRNGVRTDYFDDGTVRARGRVRDGELHGSWTWYRADGSVMRTGSFADGEPTGTWETFDRSGVLVSSRQRG